ncbi:MAG: VanZ family protein [Nitrososphaerales archaeon]
MTPDNRYRWLAVLAWMGVIFFLSAQPRLPYVVPMPFEQFQDVIGHFAAYAILAGLLNWSLTGSGARRPALFALLIVFLYACSDEFHQSFVPNRHPDAFDIATDLVGAGFALLMLNLLRSRRARRPLP